MRRCGFGGFGCAWSAGAIFPAVLVGVSIRYANEYCRVVLKLNVGRNRRKLPWHEYLSTIVGILVGVQVIGLLSDLGLLIAAVGALAGGFAALYLAYELGKRLGERFPALKSEHVGYFDR